MIESTREIALRPGLAKIPERLLLAHARGEVLFVFGAGVSQPACLPGFRQLVLDVYCRLDPAVHAVIKSLPQGRPHGNGLAFAVRKAHRPPVCRGGQLRRTRLRRCAWHARTSNRRTPSAWSESASRDRRHPPWNPCTTRANTPRDRESGSSWRSVPRRDDELRPPVRRSSKTASPDVLPRLDSPPHLAAGIRGRVPHPRGASRR